MTNIVNRRTSTAIVAIAALASVLVVSTSVISGHIALAQTNSGSNSNSGIELGQSNSRTDTCETAGGTSPVTNSCTGSQSNTNTNSGGVH